ncbi:hypothetical protein FGG78_25195 [Thioclava sp. BHET1]|nr:hypothetical protein FGG78_25195 [Thioclava sp. BHET1]
MYRLLLCLGLLAALAACGSNRPVATQDAVTQAAYHDPSDPPSLTVMTTIRNTTGSGAHSSLLINASQRVIFDPAGSFQSPEVPQRGDVLYGITPRRLEAYIRFQSTEGFHVVAERIPVSPEVAQMALNEAIHNGSASQGLCADNVSTLLKKLPGMPVRTALFPKQVMREVSKMPDAVRTVYYDGVPRSDASESRVARATGGAQAVGN